MKCMNTILTVLLILTATLVQLTCKKPTEPNGELPVSLTALDASCTEVWLHVSLAAGFQPRTIQIQRNALPILTTTLLSPETLLVDTGLLPNHEYTYSLTCSQMVCPQPVVVSTRTLDTTSASGWTWTIDTLGTTSPSTLNDIAIVRAEPDSPLVLAVGEMYLAGEPTRYNLAMWEGSTWRIERVPYYYQGQPFYHPIQTIFAFGPDEIWFAGNGVIRWNGQQYVPIEIPPSVWGQDRINKIWGYDGKILIVGDGGSIAHKSTTGVWQRLESGTNIDVRDIWGGSFNNRTEIVAVASFGSQVPQERKVLAIEGTSVSLVSDQSLPLAISAVWFMPFRKYLIGGAGVFSTYRLGSPWQEDISQPLYYVSSIRGTGWNQVALSGGYGHLSYFNGVRWKHFAGSELPYIQGNLSAVAIKGNLLVSVGWLSNGKAIAVIGRR